MSFMIIYFMIGAVLCLGILARTAKQNDGSIPPNHPNVCWAGSCLFVWPVFVCTFALLALVSVAVKLTNK